MVSALFGVVVLVGCVGIPQEQLKNYALIESSISERGQNMDTAKPNSQGIPESTAYISWINGRSVFPASPSKNVLPGEYEFSVGINCSNSGLCRPSPAITLKVKAGLRYVLTPNGVLVSDRNLPRDKSTETLYRPGS